MKRREVARRVPDRMESVRLPQQGRPTGFLPPDRAELIERYGDAEDDVVSADNRTRVLRAVEAVSAYAVVTGQTQDVDADWSQVDDEVAITDLICDLLHLATAVGLDAERLHEWAWMHFGAEVGAGYQ